jgi:hypothetical protein
MVDNVSDDALLDRLILNEPAQEITVTPEEFNREWVTLKDCTTIFGVKTKKAVYDIIKREGLVSKVFMIGQKPVRHVSRNGINEYLGKRQSDANAVEVRDKDANVTNKLLTQELGNMLVSVRDIPNQVRDLTEAIRNVNNNMANIIQKIVDQGIDLKTKWLEDRERRAEADQQERGRRAEIDTKQLNIQEKNLSLQQDQLKAQQDLISKVTEQSKEQQEIISKVIAQPKSTPALWIVPVASLVIALAVIGSLIYWGGNYIGRQAQERDKALSSMQSQISAVEKDYNRTLVEMTEKDKEISQLKDFVIANQGDRK